MQSTGVAFTIFGMDIYWYGIIITFGILVGIMVATKLSKIRGYNSEMLLDFVFLGVPMGIVGARLYYVIFSWDEFAGRLDTIFSLRMTGLAIYGGVIGGIIAALIFAKWKKVSFWDIADSCTPALILAQAMGRWGNFFNQEVYGAVVNNVSLQVSEHLALIPPAAFIDATGQWHLALFLIESSWNLLTFFALLLVWRKYPQKKGVAFCMYLLMYCGARFILEGFRLEVYTLYFLGMRVSQLLSLITVVFAAVVFYRCLKQGGFGETPIPDKYRFKTGGDDDAAAQNT